MENLIIEKIDQGKIILLSFSLISSLFIIILYFFHENLRTCIYKLSFIIAISELFNIIPQFFEYNDKTKNIINVCITFSDCLTLLTLFQFSIEIYNYLYNNTNVKSYNLFLFIISIIYSFVIKLIGILFKENELPRIDLFNEKKKIISYIHSIIITIFSVLNYIFIFLIKKKIYQLSNNDILNGWKVFSIVNNLTNFPFIGIINWFFLWIGYVVSFFSNNPRLIGIFYCLNEIFLCLRCFLLFILFITSQKVKENIYTSIKNFLKPMNINIEFQTQYE